MNQLPPNTLYTSGASRAIEVLGDAWVLRLLRTSFRGTRRFSEFMRTLKVSRAVLSDRLERMVNDRLLVKVCEPGGHPEYRLSDRGLALWGTLVAMWQWEIHWGTDDDEAPEDRPRGQMVHLGCGAAIDPVYACTHCRLPVLPFETRAQGAWQIGTPQPGQQDGATRKRFRQSHSDARITLPTLMRVYGDRWNATIMAAALQGQRTFSEFEDATGIWPTSLTSRLEELQKLGMLRARAYAGSRQEYRMTRAAIATYPITLELLQWGDQWLWDNRPPMTVVHQTCGHRLNAKWYCPACDKPLSRSTIRFMSLEPPASALSKQ